MDKPDKATVIFSWKAHPARQHPRKLAAALVVIALVGAGVGLTAGHWVAGVLGAALLLASMQRFFFPSSFEIDEVGITANYLLTRKRAKWADIRRFASDEHGGYLSTRSAPNWTDAYRGVHIVFGASRENAVNAIRERISFSRAPESAQGSASAANRQQPTAKSHAAGAHA